MSNDKPQTHPVQFYDNTRPRVQTDDHYPLRKDERRPYTYTGAMRWSELGVLQQEVQYLGTGTIAWIDVPREGQ